MNLNFLRSLNYLYFTSYWTSPAASADGATDEGAGCSIPGGTTFGSVGDVHLRARLRAIRRLGSVLPMHASVHVFMTNVHHPLGRDLLCH